MGHEGSTPSQLRGRRARSAGLARPSASRLLRRITRQLGNAGAVHNAALAIERRQREEASITAALSDLSASTPRPTGRRPGGRAAS